MPRMHACRPMLFAALWALSAVVAAVEGKAAPMAPLSVEEATADAISWSAALSPSGRYLAAVRNINKVHMVAVVDLEQEDAAPTGAPVPDGEVQWVAWDSDDRLLFAATFWIDDRGYIVPSENVHFIPRVQQVARLFAIDREGAHRTMLFADNTEALRSRDLTRVTDFLRDDPQHVIVPAYYFGNIDLFRVNVHTGKSARIAKGNTLTFAWFTDSEGHPAFRLDSNGRGSQTHVYSRKGPGNVPPGDLEWERTHTIQLTTEQNKAPPEFYPLGFGPEPNSYYVKARLDGADTSGIYLYDFVAQKYLKTLASEPGVDIETMFINRRTRAFGGVQYYTDRLVTKMADPKVQAHLKALDRYFGGEVDLHVVGYDDAGQTWLLYTVGPKDGGSWHVYRLKDRYVREVAHYLPVIDAHRLGTTKVLRYRARDGLEIMGYLTVPPGHRAGASPPLVMLPHGGPEVRDTYGYDPLVQLLATRGYQVFQPNFRGSSGFGKKFADSGKRQWGAAMQNDLVDAFEFLVREGHAAQDRACIVGASYGGYAALAAATLTPDLFRCAVSLAGISDLPEHLGHKRFQMRGNEDLWNYMKRQIGDPKADRAMLEANSPVRFAGAVKVPVLLIHGEEDDNVPIEQSEMMDKALRKAGKDVRFVRLKDAGHSPDNEELRIVYPAILEFLERHLPAGSAKPPEVSGR